MAKNKIIETEIIDVAETEVNSTQAKVKKSSSFKKIVLNIIILVLVFGVGVISGVVGSKIVSNHRNSEFKYRINNYTQDNGIRGPMNSQNKKYEHYSKQNSNQTHMPGCNPNNQPS